MSKKAQNKTSTYPKDNSAGRASSVKEEAPRLKSRSPKLSLRDRRKRLGISQALFAEIGGFSLRTMASYEEADTLPAKVRRQFQETLRLVEALEEILGKELVDWLQAPNQGFDDRPPLEVIKAGESDQLWAMIHQHQQLAYE